MKYAKELDSVIRETSLMERVFIISYRKWKRVKFLKGQNWKVHMFLKILFSPRHLLETNIKTLYKLCKRFQKRKICEDSNFFYTMISKIFSEKASITLLR